MNRMNFLLLCNLCNDPFAYPFTGIWVYMRMCWLDIDISSLDDGDGNGDDDDAADALMKLQWCCNFVELLLLLLLGGMCNIMVWTCSELMRHCNEDICPNKRVQISLWGINYNLRRIRLFHSLTICTPFPRPHVYSLTCPPFSVCPWIRLVVATTWPIWIHIKSPGWWLVWHCLVQCSSMNVCVLVGI